MGGTSGPPKTKGAAPSIGSRASLETYFEAVWLGTVKTVSWPPSAVYLESEA